MQNSPRIVPGHATARRNRARPLPLLNPTADARAATLAPADGTEACAERRLAAILAADAAGYSRTMREEEPGALALLNKHRSGVIACNATVTPCWNRTGDAAVL